MYINENKQNLASVLAFKVSSGLSLLVIISSVCKYAAIIIATSSMFLCKSHFLYSYVATYSDTFTYYNYLGHIAIPQVTVMIGMNKMFMECHIY